MNTKNRLSGFSCPQTPRWWGPVLPGTRCEGLDSMQIQWPRNPCRIISNTWSFQTCFSVTACSRLDEQMLTNDPRIGLWPFASLQMWLGVSLRRTFGARFWSNFRSFWGTELHDMWENAAVSTLHIEQNFTMRQAQQNWHALPNVVKFANLRPKSAQKTRQSNKCCVCVCQLHPLCNLLHYTCSWQAVTYWKTTSETLKKVFSMTTALTTVLGCVPASKILRALFSSLRIFGSLVETKDSAKNGAQNFATKSKLYWPNFARNIETQRTNIHTSLFGCVPDWKLATPATGLRSLSHARCIRMVWATLPKAREAWKQHLL